MRIRLAGSTISKLQVVETKFCDTCGSYLKEADRGLWCPRCKKQINSQRVVKKRKARKDDFGDVHVIEKSNDNIATVTRVCPKCGSEKAFHWVSSISGEHAGIRQERTLEHFKCTKCYETWNLSA